MGSTPVNTIPTNLPVAPGFDYVVAQSAEATEVASITPDGGTLTELENYAHEARLLLSSDAMRYLANDTEKSEQLVLLDQVIEKAKVNFPSEDGWVVVNLSRMEQLISEISDTTAASVLAATPVELIQSGSLAESIVMGNIPAAYELIEHRPMIALADAASDLDAVYRERNGEAVEMSDLLRKETAKLTVKQIRSSIMALTGALDGTYADETSAVKMAIMKAVRALTE